jgi:hypothetical protein
MVLTRIYVKGWHLSLLCETNASGLRFVLHRVGLHVVQGVYAITALSPSEKEGVAIAGHCAFAPIHLLLLHVQVGEGGLGAYQVRCGHSGSQFFLPGRG